MDSAKRMLSIIFLFLSSICFSQAKFKSIITVFKQPIDTVRINRTITISDNEFIISSDTKNGRDIQTLTIKNVTNFTVENFGPVVTYFCQSQDDKIAYEIAFINEKNPSKIFLTQFNLETQIMHDLEFLIEHK
jgi:hypothetical protein